MIEIINMHNEKPCEIYDIKVDRSSIFGNPFAMRGEAERNHACNLFQERFDKRMSDPSDSLYKAVYELKRLYKEYGRLRLFCWCAPKRCHAETYKKWLEDNQ